MIFHNQLSQKLTENSELMARPVIDLGDGPIIQVNLKFFELACEESRGEVLRVIFGFHHGKGLLDFSFAQGP